MDSSVYQKIQSGIKHIAATYYVFFAVTESGEVLAWGDSFYIDERYSEILEIGLQGEVRYLSSYYNGVIAHMKSGKLLYFSCPSEIFRVPGLPSPRGKIKKIVLFFRGWMAITERGSVLIMNPPGFRVPELLLSSKIIDICAFQSVRRDNRCAFVCLTEQGRVLSNVSTISNKPFKKKDIVKIEIKNDILIPTNRDGTIFKTNPFFDIRLIRN